MNSSPFRNASKKYRDRSITAQAPAPYNLHNSFHGQPIKGRRLFVDAIQKARSISPRQLACDRQTLQVCEKVTRGNGKQLAGANAPAREEYRSSRLTPTAVGTFLTGREKCGLAFKEFFNCSQFF